MVEWLAGNRIRGTSTERTSTTGFNSIPAVSGGWKELGRTTLGSAGDLVSVASLPDKRYYMVLCDNRTTGAVRMNMRFNSDSGSNYSERWSAKGVTPDSTQVSQNKMQYGQSNVNEQGFSVHNIANLTNKEKLMIANVVSDDASTGAGTSPYRNEYVSKWVPSTASDVINEISMYNTSAGSWNIGAECVVLGWDDSDTHTTNFWEELASVTTTGALATVDSGVFTSKKYLWCQIMTVGRSGVATNSRLRVGNTTIDVNDNYSSRRSADGGTETPVIDVSYAADIATNTGNQFTNLFIINNSANEKLIIGHTIDQNTAGAGTAPRRTEFVGKHVTTGSQLDIIGMYSGGSDTFDAGAVIKVWGSN